MIRPGRVSRAAVLALALLLVVVIVVIAEVGQHSQRVINGRIRVAQQRQVALADLLNELSAAQTGQRNLLLTGERRYLGVYQTQRARIDTTLTQLEGLFHQDDPALGPQQLQSAGRLRTLAQRELGELSAALALYSTQGPAQALALLRADIGSAVMAQLRADVLTLRDAERSAVSIALEREDRVRIVWRVLMGIAAALNIALLIVTGVLLARATRRRQEMTRRLEAQNHELEQRVLERTAELSALSSHLQQLSETEKASLARELHDELGGLLIAVKMDVAWLQKRTTAADQATQMRFNRILKVLDDGVDFKRRVVENLRPTLLDNMGLLPALRWITQETCSRAGLRYTEKYPNHEPQLLDSAAITIFRLVQESLTNIVRHAHASEVRLTVLLTDTALVLEVEDNGAGMTPRPHPAVGSHGLATMRHRVRSLGGRLSFMTPPTGGTRVLAQLPLASVLRPEDTSAGA